MNTLEKEKKTEEFNEIRKTETSKFIFVDISYVHEN